MHVVNSYPLYNAASRSRFLWYPTPTPPSYYYGSLYYDGNDKGAHSNSSWWTRITNRMNVPAPARIRMWGTYNPNNGMGTIYARYFAETEDLNGNILFVITEDSLYYNGPNLDVWHNHVARNYIPNYIGSAVSIARNDSLTVSYPFAISSSWNDKQVEIVTMIQSPVLSGDSMIEIWQGAKIKPMQLTIVGIEEEANPRSYFSHKVEVAPNPCAGATRFAFHLRKGIIYNIDIIDISGRKVKTLNGMANGQKESVKLDLSDINPGIYFYRFSSNTVNRTGKIIIN